MSDTETLRAVPIPTRRPPAPARPDGIQGGTPAEPKSVNYGLGKSATALRSKHRGHAEHAQLEPTRQQRHSINSFTSHYLENEKRYTAAAKRSNLPTELVAALHWRESTGNFGRYQHQGDRLGRPPVNHPTNIPTFHKWEDSAVHAFGQKARHQKALGMTNETSDLSSMAAYAEIYNGLGYHNRKRPSPYVYAGTNKYSSGKYVRDGKFDPKHVDQQPGVVALIQALRQTKNVPIPTPRPATPGGGLGTPAAKVMDKVVGQ